jgi:hypothetical protein
MHNIDEVEVAIVQAFQQFVVKLNEEQLRPMIAKLMKWGFRARDENEKFPFRLHRTIMFFKLVSISQCILMLFIDEWSY